MNSISVQNLKKKVDEGLDNSILVDVREEFEYNGEAIPKTENIPADVLNNECSRLKNVNTVYVCCRTGARSSQACSTLAKAGVNVVNVEGGIEAWKSAGFEVDFKKNTLPLVRQVMIVAGGFTLVGVLLGAFVNVWWYVVPGVIGTGLFFAGISGYCGLTKILKYMPWNK